MSLAGKETSNDIREARSCDRIDRGGKPSLGDGPGCVGPSSERDGMATETWPRHIDKPEAGTIDANGVH
jgi:hypothetical protein